MNDRLRVCARAYLGRLANRLGMPGLLKDADFHSRFGTKVRVQRGHFFTVVSVDGTNVYFDRLTGKIEHVVAYSQDHRRNRQNDCTEDLVDNFVWKPTNTNPVRAGHL